MKKCLLVASAFLLLTTACSHSSDTEDVESVPAIISAGLNGNTRAFDSTWNADAIGVSVISSTNDAMTIDAYKNVPYKTTSTDTKAEFSAQASSILFNANFTGTATFAAYAPYKKSLSNYKLSLDTQRNNGSFNDQEQNIDVLFASGAYASFSSPNVVFDNPFEFSHKMVQMNISIQTQKSSELSSEISAATSIILGGLIHQGEFDVLNGVITTTGSIVPNWDIVNAYHTDKEGVRTYSLVLLPQSLSEPLTLSITIDGKTYTNRTINPDLTYSGRAYNYMIYVIGNKGIQIEGSTITSWDKQDLIEGKAYQE